MDDWPLQWQELLREARLPDNDLDPVREEILSGVERRLAEEKRAAAGFWPGLLQHPLPFLLILTAGISYFCYYFGRFFPERNILAPLLAAWGWL